MAALVPATPQAVLTDKEWELCLRHYVTDRSVRTWISENDTPPDLVWDNSEETARLSHNLKHNVDTSATTSTPVVPVTNGRWRDQYLKLHLSKPIEQLAPSVAAAKPQEYVLISEDEEEVDDEGTDVPSSSPPPRAVAPSSRRATDTTEERAYATISPSPRASGTRVSPSQHSRASPRQSTGSSVVIMSQPAAKVAADSGVSRARASRSAGSKSNSRGRDGEGTEEMGKKRQRSMEEFMFRGS